MSWIARWIYGGVDPEEEQKRTDALNAQEKIQADRYKAGGDEYNRIVAARGEDVALRESLKVTENYDNSEAIDPNVDAALADAFATGVKESYPVQAVGAATDISKTVTTFAAKTIWKLVPWYIWALLIGGIGFYVFVNVKQFIPRKG